MKQINLTLMLLCAAFLSTFSLNAQQVCNGGEVTAFGGAQTVYTCPSDGKPDVVIFARSGQSENTKYQFVITNQENTILAMPSGSRADLDGAGEGICYVWGFAYTGNLTAKTGDNVFRTQFSTGCWAISRTRINVVRFKPDGGTVSTSDGKTAVTLCTRDGYNDAVVFNKRTNSRAAYRYLITDDKNNILLIKEDGHNFEGVPAGKCRVWGLSYTGTLTAAAGMNAATGSLATNCWDLSDNFIEIDRTNVDGGEVSLPNGQTRFLAVPGDGRPDIVTANHTTTSPAKYGYIVTSDQNVVLGLPPANSVNVEGAGPGICRVWGISYTGNLTVFLGDKVGNKALSTGCFSLSKNFIEVVRNPVDGGRVTMPDGLTTRYTCPGDGKADIVRMVTNSVTTAAQYRFVVTDDKNIIVGLPPANEVNVEGAGVGNCRIWGVSFLGNFTAQLGQNVTIARLASGSFSLSSNFIETRRDVPVGGRVTMPDGQTIRYTCPGDGIPDIVRFITTSTSNSKYQYVVTDDKNNILGLPPANEVNVEGAGVGACRIWGVAYTGKFTAKIGDNAASVALSDECFSLSSNYIETLRFQPNGGRVATTTGQTSVTVTVGDGRADNLSFAVTNNSRSRFAWVVTDDKNNILGLPSGNTVNFEDAGVGACRVWGLSYTGQLTALMGDNAATIALSTECFNLSSNFVTVNRVKNEPQPLVNGGQFSKKQLASTISPNPIINQAYVQFSEEINPEQEVRVQVINTTGMVVLDKFVNNTQVVLDLNALPSSLYIVKVSQNKIIETHKVFKQ